MLWVFEEESVSDVTGFAVELEGLFEVGDGDEVLDETGFDVEIEDDGLAETGVEDKVLLIWTIGELDGLLEVGDRDAMLLVLRVDKLELGFADVDEDTGLLVRTLDLLELEDKVLLPTPDLVELNRGVEIGVTVNFFDVVKTEEDLVLVPILDTMLDLPEDELEEVVDLSEELDSGRTVELAEAGSAI